VFLDKYGLDGPRLLVDKEEQQQDYDDEEEDEKPAAPSRATTSKTHEYYPLPYSRTRLLFGFTVIYGFKLASVTLHRKNFGNLPVRIPEIRYGLDGPGLLPDKEEQQQDYDDEEDEKEATAASATKASRHLSLPPNRMIFKGGV
jgi:hypothetical protein